MASRLQRLVRNQTLISIFNARILSSPTHLPDPPVAPIPFFNNLPKTTVESNPNPISSTVSSTFYPSFAFQGLLHPGSQIGDFGGVLVEKDVDLGGEEVGIWADSVKKKRKKKMNKHKLKKLRKRLRRKT